MGLSRARILSVGFEQDLAFETGLEVPTPTGREILVEVEACGVCYRDLIDRGGRFPFLQVPITPGHEAVGKVTAVGPDVTEWKVGDRVATMHRDFCGQCPACERGQTSLCQNAASVFGLLVDGGYATHLRAPERAFFAMDPELPAEAAAIMHCTFGTAARGLFRAQAEAGQTVLVTGANGGVGAAAIQIAARLGTTPIAVIRSEKHREFVEGLGAAEVIVNDGSSFHKALHGRIDVALECVGQPTFNASLRSLTVGGRLVTIGNVVEERASLNLGYIITRGITVLGSSGATRDDMARVLEMHAEKPFQIAIHERVPLAEADRAQRQVMSGGLCGRIVLVNE